MMDADADGFGGYFLFLRLEWSNDILEEVSNATQAKILKFLTASTPGLDLLFGENTWSWKRRFLSNLFLPLATSGVLLSRTDFWFKTARQIDNRQIRPAFLPAGCNCDKKPLLNGRGGEMIEEERAKQTRLGPGNLLGCSKMALPDGRSYAGILSCWKHDLCH